MKPAPAFLLLTAVLGLSGSLTAESLKKAEITQIINEVGILQPDQKERSAAVNDVIEGKIGVRTGQKSRAELVFADQTLTRLGSNTIFNFEDGSRNMDLSQGTILLQVPKNAGGATIRTAAVTAAVTGTTILFEHTPAPVVPDKLKKSESRRHRKPHGYIKAMVLEGHLKVWLKGNLGESILLGPGQMLIMADDAMTIPEPVDFDVETVMETSKLINQLFWMGHKRRLESTLIGLEVAKQRKEKKSGNLIETNLFINGRGTTVMLASADEPRQQVKDSMPTPSPTPTPTPTPSPSPSPTPTPTPSPTPPENDLATFSFTGSTGIFSSDTSGSFDPTFPGNARIVASLPDNSGGTTVLPTSGTSFGVLSTGGTAPSGSPYTGTRGIAPINATLGQRSFVELDYRFLTNEIGKGTGSNDRAIFTISGANGMTVSYVIDRDQLQSNGVSLTPLARANVGGFLAGTDWLTLKLEVTPFISAGNATFTLTILDSGTAGGDSALPIDRYQVTTEFLVAPNSDLAGNYTALFPLGITFGEGAGEYRAPGLRGRENTAVTGPGSNGGVFNASTTNGDLIVNAPIMADTGPNKVVTFGGEGGSVNLSSANAAVRVNSRIQVASDDSNTRRVSASGGSISVSSSRIGGNGIVISNTGELLSILNAASPGPTGNISIQTTDSDILVSGGKVIADRGVVDIRTTGANSTITLNNAQIRSDVVKIGALGNNGQLIIGGGQLSADSTLKLYAGGSAGTITFVANVQLGVKSAQKIISANTVTVRNGVSVQVSGSSATVFTSNPNYSGSGGNDSTTGVFTGSGAQTFQPTNTPAPVVPSFD